jgi:hypothetical protein
MTKLFSSALAASSNKSHTVGTVFGQSPMRGINDGSGHKLCENYFRKMKVGNTLLIYIRIDRKVGIRMQDTL